MNPYYAGIGSRKTPQPILEMMTAIARHYQIDGSILRSGGAVGADTAFESGAGVAKEIFLARHATPEAYELTAKYHPAWHKCSPWAKAFHARNALIILGRDLKTPVRIVICWTEAAKGGGGTGQGIRIADAYGIEVHDLADPEIRRIYTDWLTHIRKHGEHTCDISGKCSASSGY